MLLSLISSLGYSYLLFSFGNASIIWESCTYTWFMFMYLLCLLSNTEMLLALISTVFKRLAPVALSIAS
jgi:hypothetical protein